LDLDFDLIFQQQLVQQPLYTPTIAFAFFLHIPIRLRLYCDERLLRRCGMQSIRDLCSWWHQQPYRSFTHVEWLFKAPQHLHGVQALGFHFRK
jgi:hypothetical protein